MNILYLAHRIPYPPNKGDKLRAFRQIEHLARRHRVWCACFVDDPRDFRHVQKLREYCKDVAAIELRPLSAKARGLWSLARGGTIAEGFYASREMSAALANWGSQTHFDAVVAFSSSMAPYALNVSAPRRILDLCDLDSLKWSDYAAHLRSKPGSRFRDRTLAAIFQTESARLASAERRWIDGFDAALLATEIEAAPLRGLVKDRKLHVVGNGVELPSLALTNPIEDIPDPAMTVGFVGVMDYLPNVDAVSWFACESWPLIRRQFPNATFRIVGRSPVRAVRNLARIAGVHVVGEVESVSDELSRFDVSVVPLRIARGVQNKVLEAMAAAKAVVLTPMAAKGIAAVASRDYVVAESAREFALAIGSLLADAPARRRIGQSAREFVAHHRRWEPEMEKFEALVTRGSPPCQVPLPHIHFAVSPSPASPTLTLAAPT